MNDKQPYEIDTDSIREAGKPNAMRDLLRGLVADTRGMLEGRQMRRQASDKNQKAIADEAYRQRIASVQEKQLLLQQDSGELNKQKFEEQKRKQILIEEQDAKALKSQEAEKAALEAMQKLWSGHLKDWSEARLMLQSLSDADPATKKRLTEQLHTMGPLLEANAKRLGLEFSGYSDWVKSDETATEEKEKTDALEAEKQKKIDYINNHPEWDDAMKTALTAQVEIAPEASMSELINSVKSEQKLTDTEAETEAKRLEDVEIAKQHAEKYKDQIIANRNEATYEDLIYDITHAEKPLEIDVEPYLTPEDDDTAADNKLAKEMAGYKAELKKQGIPEERINELMTRRLIKEAEGSPTQGELAFSKVMDPHESVKDLQPYVVAIGAKGNPSTRKTAVQWMAIGEFIQTGNREMVLDSLGDVYDNLDKSKEANHRFESARIMQNIRDKIINLETKFGLETSRTLTAITERMTEQSFNAWWQGGSVDFFTGMNLTDEQLTAAVELQTYINNNLVSFIKNVSGTAVAEQEYGRLVRIMPGLFKNTAANMGIIDGNINLLRDQQFYYYSDHSNEEVAREIMATQGWGNIRTSTETSEIDADGIWNKYRNEGD